MKKIGVKQPVQVVQHNVTVERVEGGKKRDYREFYDAPSIALVERLYAPVIDRFGYTFDPK